MPAASGRVTAVLFDLDDTLFDHRSCARAALEAVYGSHEGFAGMPFAEIERRHADILEELHHQVMLGVVKLDAARTERFRRLYASAGLEAGERVAAEAASLYRSRYLDARRAIAGAVALLGLVKQRASIAVVSNNLLDEQQAKLRFCGMDRFVDALVVSEEVGVSKPDPRIFQVALERLNADAPSAVMVGDSWTADVVGARAAGIRVIWFNCRAVAPPDPGAGVPELRSLDPPDEAMRLIFDAHRD